MGAFCILMSLRTSPQTGVAISCNHDWPCCGARKKHRAYAVPRFFDRCHSLASLHLPQAALGSLPRTDSRVARPRTDSLSLRLCRRRPRTDSLHLCLWHKLRCHRRPAGDEQHATGMLHWMIRVLIDAAKKKTPSKWMAFLFGDPERTRTVDLQRDRLAC